MDAKLIIFDADGTLCDRDTGALLPDVAPVLALLTHPGVRNRPALAIATNQGGPACRDAGWGTHFPALRDVEERYARLAEQFGARLYVALSFVTKQNEVILPHGLSPDDPRARLDWRKPQPGMLLQAMEDAGVSPADTLMIGDRPEDQEAARAAGCAFIWAQGYFARGWEPGKDYGILPTLGETYHGGGAK